MWYAWFAVGLIVGVIIGIPVGAYWMAYRFGQVFVRIIGKRR